VSQSFADTPSQESNFLKSNLSASAKLERARMELLDLSARNRLLNIPRHAKTARTIEVVDEKSDEIFRILVTENKPFTFLPGRAATGAAADPAMADSDEIDELAQPDESVNERGVFNRHADTRLQTRLTSKGLQKRLLDLYVDARTLEEEQGVNILFLGLGTLKWVDPVSKNSRYAPLLLIPVSLVRGNAAEQFKLKWRQEEPAANLSLEAFLEQIHKLRLPPFENGEDVNPGDYFAEVARCVSSKTDWEVLSDDIVLGFFSFAKFLMYRDLDPAAWPTDSGLLEQPLIRGLLSDGFAHTESLLSDDAMLDRHLAPEKLLHIVDCDSSQTLAVHDARAGRNLVIQGPPGTGKSQTIANLIAAAIADGKTVLFVAEKMAALEVVKRRLDMAGVGDACLELHSNKANKRMMLDELRRTAELGSPKGQFPNTLNARLNEARELLNQHAGRMHQPHPKAALTPYQVIGQLARLRQQQLAPVEIRLHEPETWSPDQRMMRIGLIKELAQRVSEIGTPSLHPWYGVGLSAILPTDVERLMLRLAQLHAHATQIVAAQTTLAASLALPVPATLAQFRQHSELASKIAQAPGLSDAALTAPVWDSHGHELATLLSHGLQFSALFDELDGNVMPEAWGANVAALHALLALLPPEFGPDGTLRLQTLSTLLPPFLAEVTRLAQAMGTSSVPDSVAAIERAIQTGERVAQAPDGSAEAFAAHVWDNGVEQAFELAQAVATLEQCRQALQDKVLPLAFTTELGPTRQILAVHGQSLFRFLRKDWRAASALTKSILKVPDTPLAQQLAILDQLGVAQQALALIRAQDDFGKAAFGDDWRMERSTSAPLLALVAWIRSLRGMGAEPRLIASRLPDRGMLGECSNRVKNGLAEILPILTACWQDCGTTVSHAQDAPDANHASLTSWLSHLSRLADAQRQCAALIRMPARIDATLSRLAGLMAAQQAIAAIHAGNELGAQAFAPLWRREYSDWQQLAEAAQWQVDNQALRALVARHAERQQAATQANAITHELDTLFGDFAQLMVDLHTNSDKLFAVANATDIPLPDLMARSTLWMAQHEQLSSWVAFRERFDQARLAGLGPLVAQLNSGELAPENALTTFEMAYYEALFKQQVKQEPALAKFDGQLHSRKVLEFIGLDQERIALSRLEVAQAHHRKIPPMTGGGVGPLGVLRGEMARRRGHMPIRQLMLKAAPAISAIKPVLMMSPLSVAQFLPPGQLNFDLLVMDEASQIQPVDALGAIARCRQVVVVGDERQLPPTKFFAKVTGSQDDDSEGDGAQVADIESILGLFRARGLPQRMLRWHYRSRHQSLIAISNSQFYENKLFIVPSPYTQEAGMGLQFHHVANGVFDSGNSNTNHEEAKAVAAAIIRHAGQSPEHSLGVATFSVAQRRAIWDQLELLRRNHPECEAFFNAHPSEPFFIKNLENVQGDERDVIFISVGYGRNVQGYMAMRFGPLSAEGGERRLNVLISRAKRRCQVYASITDEDIDLERGKGVGVLAFKMFLRYARTGQITSTQTSERDYDSAFEVQVAQALQAHGYLVHPQVGIAGFFIDLAIADATRPGRYILGIECDGATYHSSRSARDRDRLRQAVLEDHGWIMHRIWSIDWFQRPQQQLQQAIAAIEAAKQELDARMETSLAKNRIAPIDIVTIDRGDHIEVGLSRDSSAERQNSGSTPYIEAALIRPAASTELLDTPIAELVNMVHQVVKIEGPLHVDEVAVRLRQAFGLKRTGTRIQAVAERCIKALLDSKSIIQQANFLLTSETKIVIRDRSGVQSDALKKPEMLPPQEIDTAIKATVQGNFGASADEIVQTVARLFGFKATSSTLRETILERINSLLTQAALEQQGNIFTISKENAGT
jgi:very-short-patch-repair endonuclease